MDEAYKERLKYKDKFFLVMDIAGNMKVGETLWLAVGDVVRPDDHPVFMIIDRANRRVMTQDWLYHMIRQPNRRLYSGPMEENNMMMKFQLPEQSETNLRRIIYDWGWEIRVGVKRPSEDDVMRQLTVNTFRIHYQVTEPLYRQIWGQLLVDPEAVDPPAQEDDDDDVPQAQLELLHIEE